MEEKEYTTAAISQAEMPGMATHAYLFLSFLSLPNREKNKVVSVCAKGRLQGETVSCLNGDCLRMSEQNFLRSGKTNQSQE